MIFSKRKQLETEYYEWLSKGIDTGAPIADCPFNVISFLDSRGLLKSEDSRNLIELRFVDATPDPLYPQRILQAYLDTGKFTDNTSGLDPKDPLIIAMNELQEKRNSLLREALAKLSTF